jgi:hypothetical protein
MIARVRITEAGRIAGSQQARGWQGGPYQRATPLFYPFALNG